MDAGRKAIIAAGAWVHQSRSAPPSREQCPHSRGSSFWPLALLGVLFSLMPLLTGAQGATYRLISDELSPSAAFVGIRIDGQEIPECGSLANHCTSPEGAGLKLDHDITHLVVAAQDVTIEARACNQLGQCSDWSAPQVFELSKPATPKGLRIDITVNVSVSSP